MKNKRKARELALQTLYASEMRAGENCRHIMESIAESGSYDSDAKKYAEDLVTDATDNQEEIDKLISAHAANWELRRMAAIDRNVLRIAVTELRYFPQVPHKVVIDEAVELAKIYGTDESSRFVNGVIDSIYRNISSQKGTDQTRET